LPLLKFQPSYVTALIYITLLYTELGLHCNKQQLVILHCTTVTRLLPSETTSAFVATSRPRLERNLP